MVMFFTEKKREEQVSQSFFTPHSVIMFFLLVLFPLLDIQRNLLIKCDVQALGRRERKRERMRVRQRKRERQKQRKRKRERERERKRVKGVG